MKPRVPDFAVAALVVVSVATCKAENPYEDALEFLAPVATASSIAYVDQGRDQIIFVMPGDSELDIVTAPLGDDRDVAMWAKPTLDGSELLVLTVPASEKEEDVTEVLHRFPADGDGEPATYEIGSPFGQVALSPDMQHAVLHGAQDQLQNDNLIAVVDLEGSDVRNLTLEGFGGRLTSVHFPGQSVPGEPAPIDIGGYERNIAAFLAPGEVVMVDLDNPEVDHVAAPFEMAQDFNPVDTLLRPADGLFKDPVLFVRSSTGSDVAMLTLINQPDELTGEPGFTAQVNLISVGLGASDLLYYDAEEIPYLLTVDSQSRELVFTDIGTLNEGVRVGLDGNATQVFLRDHETPEGTVRQAVTWSQFERSVFTLDLGDIESTTGRQTKSYKIETGIEQLVVLDNDRVLIGSTSTLYVVDFAGDQVTPLTSQVPYDPHSSALDGNLLLLGTPGQFYVSSVDLDTLQPDSIILDDAIGSFHYLAGSHKLVAVHSEPTGHMTVVPSTGPSRADSYVSWGFLLDGVFD